MRRQAFGRSLGTSGYVAAALLCVACGGGGGGDSSPPPTSPPPANQSRPPIATDSLALTSANAVDAATLVLGFAEITLAFGQIASDWTQAMRLVSGTLVQTAACPGGGAQSLTLLDSDASGNVSKGDTVQAVLTNCYLPALEGAVTGSAVLQITSFNEGGIRDGGGLTLGPTFGFTDNGVGINFGGTFQYSLTDGRLGTLLRVTSPNWSASLRDGSASAIETVRDVDASRSIRRDAARAETGIVAMRLVSELLRGTVTATSDAPLSSFFDRYPDSGRISIAGANGTAVLSLAGASASTASVSFGGASITLAVDDASSGYLWSGTGITPPPDEFGFRTRIATTTEFVVLQGPDFLNVRPSSRMSWQLSRPATAGTVSACQLDKMRLRSGYNWGAMSVDCDVTVTGALVEMQPRTQLVPGSAYFPTYTPSAGFPNSFQLTDANGNTINLATPPFDVVDTVAARPALGFPGYIFGTLTQTLDASQSQAQGAPVTTFQWRHVSGPAILFDNDKVSMPVVRAGAGVGNGIAVVEVQVANSAGDSTTTGSTSAWSRNLLAR